jgi:hypothetical protein
VPALPVLVLTALWFKVRRGQALCSREVLRLPASSLDADCPTFFLFSFWPEEATPNPRGVPPTLRGFVLGFLPALLNVAGGCRFVGLPPRSREEVLNLSEDWQSVYLRGKPGIVTEPAVLYRHEPTTHEQYATERCMCSRWASTRRVDFIALLRSTVLPFPVMSHRFPEGLIHATLSRHPPGPTSLAPGPPRRLRRGTKAPVPSGPSPAALSWG